MPKNCAAIVIAAKHGRLIKVKDYEGIADTVGALRCRFEFRTNDWDNANITAVFCKGNVSTDPSIIENAIGVILDGENECAVPAEVLTRDSKYFSVGVWGITSSGLRIVSEWLVFRIKDGCYVDSAAPIEPTPTVYEQIMNSLSMKASINHTHDNYASIDEVKNKQDVLISGTNIKTINGQDILGEGDIVIQGGSGDGCGITVVEEPDIEKEYGAKEVYNANINNLMFNELLQLIEEQEIDKTNRVNENSEESKIPTAKAVYNYGQHILETHKELMSQGVGESQSNYPSCYAVFEALKRKQDVLTSGFTIKTINGEDILGFGDLSISGGGGSSLEYIGAFSVEEGVSQVTFDLGKAYKELYIFDTNTGSAVTSGEYNVYGNSLHAHRLIAKSVSGVKSWVHRRFHIIGMVANNGLPWIYSTCSAGATRAITQESGFATYTNYTSIGDMARPNKLVFAVSDSTATFNNTTWEIWGVSV